MKNLLFITLFVLNVLTINAQKLFGVQAGVKFATLKTDYFGLSTAGNIGIVVGAVADLEIGNHVSLRPEFNFIQKGGEFEKSTFTAQNESNFFQKIKLNYIQLSPNLVYNIIAGKEKFFIGFGPEFSFGIGGTVYTKESRSSIGFFYYNSETNVKVKYDGKNNYRPADEKYHRKSFDYGLNFLLGYKITQKFFISTSYSKGLANISTDEFNSMKNSGFNVKLGFMFAH